MVNVESDFMWGPASHVLRVSLQDVEPEIWRTVRISSDSELAELNAVLVVAMGWQGYHLHEFQVGPIRFGVHEDDEKLIDELGIRVEQMLPAAGVTATWTYDFGDSWTHTVVVDAIEPRGDASKPQVLGGKRACPPEDSGGTWGYLDKLRVLADPSDEEHDFIAEWMPDGFDSEAFDIEAVNRRLRSR